MHPKCTTSLVPGEVSCYLPQSDGALAQDQDPTTQKIQICMAVELSLRISQMASLVRSAEVHGERAILTAFLSKYLSPDADEGRYERLYCKNPPRARREYGQSAKLGQAGLSDCRPHFPGESTATMRQFEATSWAIFVFIRTIAVLAQHWRFKDALSRTSPGKAPDLSNSE